MIFKSLNKNEDDKRRIWLKDGQEVKGIFRGDIHESQIHWRDKKKVPCFGSGCEICATGEKSKFQFRINFIHKDTDDNLVSSLYEGNWGAYQRLAKINEEHPLENYMVRMYKGEENGFKADLFERMAELSPERLQTIQSISLESVLDDEQKPSPFPEDTF